MSLLGLTASASIVAGVFVAAAPAYSDDGVGDASASCLVAAEEDATLRVSSTLHAGEPVHAEGSGWGPSSGTTRGFVIVTLDDGKELRPVDSSLPDWVPAAVARDRSAWTVLEVGTDGSFSADIDIPSTWEVGSSHLIAIGDGVTGTYVTVTVSVVDAQVMVRSCSLAVDDPTPVDPNQGGDGGEPGGDATASNDSDPAHSIVMPPSVPADEQAEPVVTTSQVIGAHSSGEESAAEVRPGAREVEASSPSPLPSVSATSPSARGASSSGGAGGAVDPTPQASASTEQQSVAASQIGPKANTEQHANEQAAREEEGRLNGWILAGGGLLALLGAVVTVSIVRRPHAGVH